jgi:hypothetical protein
MSVVSISYSMFFTNTFAFVFIVNISYLSYILGVLTLYSRLKLIKVSRLSTKHQHIDYLYLHVHQTYLINI